MRLCAVLACCVEHMLPLRRIRTAAAQQSSVYQTPRIPDMCHAPCATHHAPGSSK
ncbi:uncharacterized protein M421DRAFT_144485 [Didymella exigua CBS 183.55]|uniref:Uncharacterized protein n=1 Tax=Didymella exigua CBS 183.55 TaxID=1150837 RepID=A0A6A5RKS1_9PLEO|nr:uncharacterized protein M421DRAFT_144485 [Didymella exigua CBS 183.55]KAF1929005.1 hypothetical protein M421DRAFT_144485 [Didymella exigua CBS 183.55]